MSSSQCALILCIYSIQRASAWMGYMGNSGHADTVKAPITGDHTILADDISPWIPGARTNYGTSCKSPMHVVI